MSRGFFRALFDLSFRTFITRRLASVFYLVGLIAIAIGFIVYFVSGLVSGINALFFNVGAGISLIIATLILVPIATFLAIVDPQVRDRGGRRTHRDRREHRAHRRAHPGGVGAPLSMRSCEELDLAGRAVPQSQTLRSSPRVKSAQ